MVSNDGAAMAAGAVVLWRLLRGLREPYRPADLALLGLALGLGLATKSTLLVYLPAAAVAAVACRGEGRPRWWAAAVVLLVAALPVAWWWWHNQTSYGSALVRAHARPTLYSVPHLLAASRDLGSDLLVLATSLLTVSVVWLPTCVMPLWLLLNRLALSYLVGGLCWVLALLCLLGPRGRPADIFTRPQRLARRYSLALVVLMLLIYTHQYLFQDFLVALFAGRYFLTIFGAILVPLLTGWAVSLGARQRAGAGRRLALFGVAASLLCWPIVVSPPAG